MTASAIDGVTPLVHATPGCAVQAGLWSGQAGCGAARRVVDLESGGKTHRVRRRLAAARADQEHAEHSCRGELTVVITGCPAEMIGDDVAAMAQEARDVGEDMIDLARQDFAAPPITATRSF